MNKLLFQESHLLHQIFEIQAKQNPDAIALTYQGENLTYQQLNKKANQLAHYLQELGVKPEVMVGLYVERSLSTIVGMLGIIKAGGAYVPLDPAYPQERLNYILQDSQVAILVTQSHLSSKINYRGKRILLDQEQKIIAQKSLSNPYSNVKPHNLLYVIYTSGSTGEPKGVMIAHENVVSLFEGINQYLDLGKNDIWTLFHSYSFGFSVWEIWGALLHGDRLIIVPEEITKSPEAFYDLVIQEKVTILSQTPTAFRLFTHVDNHKQINSLSLRYIIFSGEALEPYLLKSWFEHHGDNKPKLVNMYAITETGGEVAYHHFTKQDLNSDHGSLIGFPLPHVQIYLFNQEMQPVTEGEVGEIYIAGNSVARGYLNQPQLTAEKFIPNPFDNSSKLYKTGDLARYLPDGKIEFMGRVDDQVKISGYRVEIREIEAKLTEHPQVQQAVVIVDPSSLNKELVAYIVREQNFSHQLPSNSEIPNFVKQNQHLEIWPSLGEYNIYDDLLYYIMGQEAAANDGLKNLVKESVKDKIVVDIGTGQEAIFARLCGEFGAKKVYAIELLETAYEKAKTLVNNLNLQDKIEVILGDSTSVNLPEKADIAISRIFGNIGSSDGVVNILNDARRFLAENGVILPRKCITKIAAVSLPENFRNHPKITDLAKHYFEKTFVEVGYPFDVRLCVRNFPKSNIISDSEVFEDLDFADRVNPEYERKARFTINQDRILDGFLLWLNISGDDEKIAVDYLEHQLGWLPVFLPVFDSGVNVNKGDIIEANWSCKLSENGLNPDYKIKGKLIKNHGEEIPFEFESFHKKPIFKHNNFYDRLFSHNFDSQTIPTSLNQKVGGKITITPQNLQQYLQGKLPDYMIPSAFVLLNKLPLSPNGKLERQALPIPDENSRVTDKDYIAPSNPLEQDLAQIWSSVLKIDRIGLNDNFFELGGDSIKAMEFSNTIQDLWQDYVYITAIFEAPTIAKLTPYLCQNYPQTVIRIYGEETIEKYRKKNLTKNSITEKNNQEIADILNELEEMSEEEAQQLLTEKIAQESNLTQVFDSEDEYFMRLAIAEAKKAIEKNQPPYAACIVKNGKVVSCVHNMILQNQDITAHAEIQAIREACQKLQTTDLSGCVIYSTCEPCSMCLTACHWAKISKIFYGLRMEDEPKMGLSKATISAERMNSLGNFYLNIVGNFLREEMFEVIEIWLKQKSRTILYDRGAEQYKKKESLVRKYIETYTLLDMIEKIGNFREKSVLDFGCGEGYYSRIFKRNGAKEVVGIDVSPKMIELAKEEELKENLGIEYKVFNVINLGKIREFDLVVAVYLLHYARTQEELLTMCEIIYQNLKPGGYLIALNENTEPNIEVYSKYKKYGISKSISLPLQEGSKITYTMFNGSEYFDLINYYYSKEVLTRILKSVGFKNISWQPMKVEPEGIKKYGNTYWQDFIENPPSIGLICQK